MKRYLSRALPIAAVLVLLAGSQPLGAQTSLRCTNPGPPCRNAIIVDTANCDKSTVTHEEIRFPRMVQGNPNRDIRVTWTLPNGFGFCPQPPAQDGVFLKNQDPNSQFSPPDFGNPSGSVPCNRRSVMLVARNSVANQTYRYRIQFHSEDGTKTCRIDPTMINE